MHLLVIEDNRRLADLLRKGLAHDGHVVDIVHEGHEGLARAESDAYDAVILDLSLPGLDGLEIARQVRAGSSTVPMLMLTARDTLHDRLHGFAAGADDYLPKPFAFEELRARLRAITRRGKVLEEDRLVVDGLILDRIAHTVTRAGNLITLAPKEYALLEFLMRHPGQVCTRELILDRVWDYGAESFSNPVEVSIRRLRKAVDDGNDHRLIHTIRGAGYMIKA